MNWSLMKMTNSESPIRLQKYLARAGVASRRACEQLILDGRVAVNGQVITELGTKVQSGIDSVTVDDSLVLLEYSTVILMLNKPKGYLTAMSDDRGRHCVSELVPVQDYPGLFPIGRLDFDTTGLLLFTTDGELGNALLHPSFHVDKEYHALVQGVPTDYALKQLRQGVKLEDGITAPANVSIMKRLGSNTVLSITIHEGKKRQVKRMCKTVGYPVLQLHRAKFGPLDLGDLTEGRYRVLTEAEIASLRNAARIDLLP